MSTPGSALRSGGSAIAPNPAPRKSISGAPIPPPPAQSAAGDKVYFNIYIGESEEPRVYRIGMSSQFNQLLKLLGEGTLVYKDIRLDPTQTSQDMGFEKGQHNAVTLKFVPSEASPITMKEQNRKALELIQNRGSGGGGAAPTPQTQIPAPTAPPASLEYQQQPQQPPTPYTTPMQPPSQHQPTPAPPTVGPAVVYGHPALLQQQQQQHYSSQDPTGPAVLPALPLSQQASVPRKGPGGPQTSTGAGPRRIGLPDTPSASSFFPTSQGLNIINSSHSHLSSSSFLHDQHRNASPKAQGNNIDPSVGVLQTLLGEVLQLRQELEMERAQRLVLNNTVTALKQQVGHLEDKLSSVLSGEGQAAARGGAGQLVVRAASPPPPQTASPVPPPSTTDVLQEHLKMMELLRQQRNTRMGWN